ncbi:unnamed protein product [Pieris brassicae]|uniref:Uncharacterized protein n=1 Tax=Pieris brassicae TaxID=7116 RepID=A0A9P0T8Y0_PIEBR|nr:unnamed protein product [Pieris brassicae]
MSRPRNLSHSLSPFKSNELMRVYLWPYRNPPNGYPGGCMRVQCAHSPTRFHGVLSGPSEHCHGESVLYRYRLVT